MIEKEVQELLSFIDGNPTAYHTTASVRNILLKEGFSELLESRRWQLEPGRSYFVCRNGSSILAFRMGEQLENYSFNVAAAHTDSPCFRIKEKRRDPHGPEVHQAEHRGLRRHDLLHMDGQAAVGGRPCADKGEQCHHFPPAHAGPRPADDPQRGHPYEPRGQRQGFLQQAGGYAAPAGRCRRGRRAEKLVAAELQVAEDQILGSDLFLCIREKAAVWGCNEEFISSGRLDDQQCVFGILKGFLNAHCARSINVAAFFDNEEVGSGTKQGAASTFLYDVLHRIAQNVCPGDEDFHRAVASSFMFSADNAHAVHPNHPEYTDVNNCTYMNEGVVVKVHAGQKYTSDGMSMAVAKELAARAGVPLQYFANRSDKVGGSTLGNLAMAQVSMNCVDIGLPQLAMHSCYETAGARDIVSLIRLMEEFYASHFEETASGTLAICK